MGHPEVDVDRRCMAEALRLAARIPRRPWPNPPVGAVVVRDGQIVGRGAHHGAGTDHAEAAALREAGVLARGATLYCTLEPCNHHGRTPPCAPAIVEAGIRRVAVAMTDPNPSVCGGGLERLREAGIETERGILGGEALDLAWPFVASCAFARPFVVLKTATSLDGCFAPPPDADADAGRGPRYLTGLEARRDVHRVRRWCDVVLVGERTMAADAPRLDGRLVEPDDECPAADPLPAYADTDLSLAAGWPRAHWVFAGRCAADGPVARRIEQQGGTVIACDEGADGHIDPRSLVEQVRLRGGHVLMVEGGPALAAAFLLDGLVDRWVSYVAPVVLGGGAGWPADGPQTSFHVTRVARVGRDVKMVLDRLPFDQALNALCGPREAR